MRVGIGLAISAGFVALAFWSLGARGVTLGEVFGRLAGGKLAWIGFYTAILTLLAAIRVLRWAALVRGMGKVGWRKIWGVALLGQGAIGLLPMRLGEAVRPILIVEPGQVDLGEATATVVVERVVDGILIGLAFAVTLWFLRDMSLPAEFWVGALATTAFFGGTALVLLGATVFRERAVRLAWRLLRPLSARLASRMAILLESFLGALRAIARGRWSTGVFLTLTVANWVLSGLSLLPIFVAYDIDLPVVASFAVFWVLVVGYMIPAGPAATGTLNYAIILALGAFGVEESVTGALAILIYALILMINLVSVLIGLWLGGFTLGTVVRAWREPAPALIEGDERASDSTQAPE